MGRSKTIEDLAITVVEPSQTQWRIIENHLKQLNITRLDWFTEGAAALDDIKQFNPDLVISAMHLPDQTGTELVQAMRNDPELEGIPFMLVSSEESDYYLEPIKQAGVIAILPKPFQPSELKRALYSTLDFIEPDDTLAHIDLDNLRVLVVDDSAMARKHITRVLNNMEIHNIIHAQNGKEAAVLMESQLFDMLVTDYNMPEMDGRELTRHVREKSAQSSIPILMVTSEANSSQLAGIQQAGVSAICDKPFEPGEVKSLIQKILN